MNTIRAALCLAAALQAGTALAGDAYRCPATQPVDSLHNRSGWYVGQYAPQTGSYAGAVGSSTTLRVRADALLNTSVGGHGWNQQASGDAQATLATSSVELDFQQQANVGATLTTLNTAAPTWATGAQDTQWPAASVQGAMHALIIQRNHLRASAGTARRSHALRYARDFFEYRLAGSSDSTVDGRNRGQLQLGSETLEVELVTEYLAPPGWGNNDYCWRLFANRHGYKGFEVQLRPVLYVLGRNLNLIGDMPDIAGDYSGRIELAYDALPSRRPVY